MHSESSADKQDQDVQATHHGTPDTNDAKPAAERGLRDRGRGLCPACAFKHHGLAHTYDKFCEHADLPREDDEPPRVGDYAYARPTADVGEFQDRHTVELPHEYRGVITSVTPESPAQDTVLTVDFDDVPPGAWSPQVFYWDEVRITRAKLDQPPWS